MKFLANRKNFFKANLSKPTRLSFFIVVMFLFCGFVLLFVEARFIYQKTEQTLETERRQQSKQNVVAFSKVSLTPHFNQNIQIIQGTKNVQSIAKFQNSIFAATVGGLLQITEKGEILRHFTVLDGLPESDLTALAIFQSKLLIGTKSKGLISFDGEKFELFRLENHETKTITGLFSDSQTLLIGTFSGGLLEFDGTKIVEIKAFEKTIEHLTFLLKTDSCLIAGTFADGLWIRKNQIWKHFTSADGLSSNRIISAAIVGKNLFVATDLGVLQTSFDEILSENQTVFRQMFALPSLSSLIIENGQFFVTKDDGEIFTFDSSRETSSLNIIGRKKPANLQSSKFVEFADEIWFLSDHGVWKNKVSSADGISLTEFLKVSAENELTDNTVSALTIDQDNRVWVGTFRNGIDVFSASGGKLKHLESETVREINSLTPTTESNHIFASTSAGAIDLDENFNATIVPINADLPSHSVSYFSLFQNDKKQFTAISTAKGLYFEDKNSRRIFSTINGLPGNSIFSTLFVNNSLYVATISGLAQIENGKVVHIFKTSNSELKNNWISALCSVNDRIFIGTYGGGIFELLPAGEIRSFESETGKNFVNPNAMFFDGERLFVGTLDGVWWLDPATQKWSRIFDVLPSETVLAITGNRENIYFGTTNGIARINKNYWIKN